MANEADPSSITQDEGPGMPLDDAGPGPGQGGPPLPMQPNGMLAALAQRGQGPPITAPGPGNVAAGLMMVKSASEMLNKALQSLGVESREAKDVRRALDALTKHIPQGGTTTGVQQTQFGDMLRSTGRNALLQQIIGARGGQPQQGGGAMNQASPSMPLPGA